ncbi:MAG: hypothetical protein WAN46_08615 [Gammaproteobacteria bacterium]|jgi:hypothetical protein
MLSSAKRYQQTHHRAQASNAATRLLEQHAEGLQASVDESMFSIDTRPDPTGRVIIIGRPTRKRAEAFLNIPISDHTRKRLDEQVIGSLAMGTSALLEWALQELQRRGITVEARLQE